MFLGIAVIAAFFGGFGTWAALAPLESAAIAPGSVRIETNRKTVQHLEGGIVAEILVRDGDTVEAGQTLIRLDDTQPRGSLQLLKGRYWAARALEVRLIAERDGSESIAFPPDLTAAQKGPAATEVIRGQVSIFNAHRQAMVGQKLILQQRIAVLNEEIVGLKGKIKAQTRQLELIREEIKDVQKLYRQGLAKKTRLLALQRSEAEIEGDRGENLAMIARAGERVLEARLRISELQTAVVNAAVEELREVQNQLFDLTERIRAAEDVLNRTNIVAPLDGIVVGVQIHTPGGVIARGAPLMDIVPSRDKLVIEAQVHPNDIDVVHPGLLAHVRLTSFNMRSTRPVEGRIKSVSADRLTDERTGAAFYLARVELMQDPAEALDGASLYPGMPAEVMIVTGARTPLEYLLRPINVSLNRAFREN